MKNLSDLLKADPFAVSDNEPHSVNITVTTGIPERVDVFQGNGFQLDFNNKLFTVTKLTPMNKIFTKIQDVLDSVEMMYYVRNPMIAITGQYYELQDGWRFKDDESRHNVQMAGWKEGDDNWVAVVPLMCSGEDIDLRYRVWNSKTVGDIVFPNFSSLTKNDSGRVSDVFKVSNTGMTILFMNVTGPTNYENVNVLTGIKDFSTHNGIVYVPVCWPNESP